MASYGADIPTTIWRGRDKWPRVSRDGGVSYLARALVRVGMIPLDNWTQEERDSYLFPFEGHSPLGEFIPAYDYQTNINGGSILWFDFPSDDTWIMPGHEVEVRPVLALNFPLYRTTAGSYMSMTWTPFLLYRDATIDPDVDALDANNLYSYNREYGNNTNYQLGGYSNSLGGYCPEGLGLYPYNAYQWYKGPWQEYSSYITIWQKYQYWMVALGPFGLVVNIGEEDTRTGQSNKCNFGIHFAGHRIPGRARPEDQDPDHDTFPPVFIRNWRDNGNEQPYATNNYYGQTTETTYLLGGQYTDPVSKAVLRSRDPIWALFYNLEQFQRVMQPPSVRVPDSPRAVNGVGRHILNRVFYFPSHSMRDNTKHFAYDAPELGTNWCFPRWEECFYLPGFVVSDKQAPLGISTDPETGDDYLLWYTNVWDTMIGVKVNARTVYDDGINDLDAMYPPTIQEVHLDMSSGAGTFGDYTITNTSSFVFTPGTDEITYDTFSSDTSWLTFELDVSADPAIGDPGEYIYEVIAEIYNRSTDTETSGGEQSDGTFHHQNVLYSEKQGRDQNGTYTRRGTIQIPCGGLDKGYRHYEYADAKMIAHRQSDGFVRFRFGFDYTNNSGDEKHLGIRNVRVRKHLRKWWTLL